jgi:hypothetical protein
LAKQIYIYTVYIVTNIVSKKYRQYSTCSTVVTLNQSAHQHISHQTNVTIHHNIIIASTASNITQATNELTHFISFHFNSIQFNSIQFNSIRKNHSFVQTTRSISITGNAYSGYGTHTRKYDTDIFRFTQNP